MSVLTALHERNSHSKLMEPGPDASQLQAIVQAGLRAPDHGRLRPWHLLAIHVLSHTIGVILTSVKIIHHLRL